MRGAGERVPSRTGAAAAPKWEFSPRFPLTEVAEARRTEAETFFGVDDTRRTEEVRCRHVSESVRNRWRALFQHGRTRPTDASRSPCVETNARAPAQCAPRQHLGASDSRRKRLELPPTALARNLAPIRGPPDSLVPIPLDLDLYTKLVVLVGSLPILGRKPAKNPCGGFRRLQ